MTVALTPRMPDDPLDQTLARIRAFVSESLVPLEPLLLANDYDRLIPALAERRAEVKALGLWAPHMPRDEGGLGLSLAAFGRVSEALGWSPLGHYAFNCQAPDIGNMELLHRHGSDMQKQRFLAPLVRGDVRSCFSMTEPERAGSNPVHLDTRAVIDGDEYVITGHKWFTSSADGAAWTIVMAITDPDEPAPHRRASQILVPMHTPGVRLVRNIPVMGDAGRDYFSHAELTYDAVRVPRAFLVGRQGAGFALAQERLGPGRIHHCMRWIGYAERALDLLCRRAASRELSPGRVLGAQQTVQHWIAESRAEIHASRLMVLDAAERIDRDGAHAARVDVSLIKFYVAGMLQRVIDRAIQVHGALGVTDDTLLSFMYRHERAARIYDGPDEVHKSVVARQVLKAYGVDVAI